MSYHRNHRNRNSENAAYIHVQKDAVKTVSWNAPPRGRPTNGSYNRADINKEPKFNLCSGEALYLEKFLTPVCGLQGPANLNCYRLPSSFSRPVTTLTSQKTRKRICPCAGMHGIKKMLEKTCWGQMAWHWPSLEFCLTPPTAPCPPWVALFHSGGLFLDG